MCIGSIDLWSIGCMDLHGQFESKQGVIADLQDVLEWESRGEQGWAFSMSTDVMIGRWERLLKSSSYENSSGWGY